MANRLLACNQGMRPSIPLFMGLGKIVMAEKRAAGCQPISSTAKARPQQFPGKTSPSHGEDDPLP
jgi:hypothetical protein